MSSHLVLTVHGIRTFGQWQDRFETLIHGVDASVTVVHFRYPYFDAISYLNPLTRKSVRRKFVEDLRDWMKQHTWNRVDIFAHSFGTHLVVHGLLDMEESTRPRVDTLVLAGSVLRETFDWRPLLPTIGRVVNECGENDAVLFLNGLFTLTMGMAGRFGFHGALRSSVVNRYYPFGHSGYFGSSTEYSADDDAFMRKEWLPLLAHDRSIAARRPSQPRLLKTAVDGIGKNSTPIRMGVLVGIPLLLVVAFFTLWRVAEHERVRAEQERDRAQHASAELYGALSQMQSSLFGAYTLVEKVEPELARWRSASKTGPLGRGIGAHLGLRV